MKSVDNLLGSFVLGLFCALKWNFCNKSSGEENKQIERLLGLDVQGFKKGGDKAQEKKLRPRIVMCKRRRWSSKKE